jgi:hypothetical protein
MGTQEVLGHRNSGYRAADRPGWALSAPLEDDVHDSDSCPRTAFELDAPAPAENKKDRE